MSDIQFKCANHRVAVKAAGALAASVMLYSLLVVIWAFTSGRLYAAAAASAVQPVRQTRLLSANADPRLIKRDGEAELTVRIQRIGKPVSVSVKLGDAAPVVLQLRAGLHRYQIAVSPVKKTTAVPLVVYQANQVIGRMNATLSPPKRFTIFILPHSHMDVGYAFYAPAALRLHAIYILQALKLIAQTRQYAPAAQFRWNLEQMIEAREFLKMATPAQKKAFFAAIASGHIGLDGLYDNELTGLCQPEELVHYVAYTRRFERKYHIAIDSAMISDVPAYTWGMVPVLAKAGIKYWSWAPNGSLNAHIGHALNWNNRPFYWSSPSGRRKILCWQSCFSYWPAFSPEFPSGLVRNFQTNAKALRHFVGQFTDAHPHFKYSMIYTRWTTGDNAPPDPNLAPFVARWNRRYISPHLVIATTSQAFHALAAKYGKILPTYRGDYNGYWEDGAGSSARATSINRRAGNRLSQAQLLWSILHAPRYPLAGFDRAWQNVLLYDEHTWGAYCSWSNPYRKFTREQWAWKRRYAVRALHESNVLMWQAKQSTHAPGWSHWFAVFNTGTWPRTALVQVPPALGLASRQEARFAGVREKDVAWPSVTVVNSAGHPVPCQRMPDQSLVFLARNVQGLSARRYHVVPGHPAFAGLVPAAATAAGLSNGLISLHVSPTTGAIAVLTARGIRGNLVSRTNKTARGLNDYAYVLGPSNKNVSFSGKPQIRVMANGPLVAELEIRSTAPGCHILIRRISLVAGRKRVYISDLLDKKDAYPELEAVHIGFPFAVPHGVIRYDEPWSVIRLGRDQLPWANKNCFTENRWVDVSNRRLGVTWASVNAPMFEVGHITATRQGAVKWRLHVAKGTTIYSYAMNNYWLTNYKASQRGMIVFHYVLRPHGAFSQAAAQRFGIDTQQPLLTASISPHAQPFAPLFTLAPASVLAEACRPNADGKSYTLRIFNAGRRSATAHLVWAGGRRVQLARTGLFGHNARAIKEPITLVPLESMTLRVTPR